MSSRLFNGSREEGAKFAGLEADKPTIMFIGGSLGAKSLNNAVAQNFDKLLQNYQVIHIAGKSGYNPELRGRGYAQYEYVDKELKDLMALSDVVISRAGSNAIFELASLQKPMILVPLPNTSSRGEQSLNARNFKNKGFAEIIADENIAEEQTLLPTIAETFAKKEQYIQNMQQNPVKTTSVEDLCRIISADK